MSQPTPDRHAWAQPQVEDLGGGVYRIPLPLGMDALRAVNIYAITDAEGVDLIDGGRNEVVVNAAPHQAHALAPRHVFAGERPHGPLELHLG